MPTSLHKYFALFSLIFLTKIATAQDPHFSQFYNQNLAVNPAFAGLYENTHAGLLFKNQWFNIQNGFKTFNIAVDARVPEMGGGIGLLIQSDMEGNGLLKTNDIGAMYSYRIQLLKNKLVLQAAMKVSYVQQSVNLSKFTFGNQLDATQGLISTNQHLKLPTDSKIGFIDFTNGYAGYYNHHKTKRSPKIAFTSSFGVTFNHITQPEQSLILQSAKLPLKFNLYYTAVIPIAKYYEINSNKVLMLGSMYEQQSTFSEFTFGANIKRLPFYCGIWFRERNIAFSNIDALILTIGVDKQFDKYSVIRFGYSYDFTISKLVGQSPGSHELSISYANNYSKNKQKRLMGKKQSCFRF
ncbi:MAG: hypothetical protein RIQ33_2048 [Bacteroidota bacterium]|jgi:type IX secretion system PorP/SprF family membrane protein